MNDERPKKPVKSGAWKLAAGLILVILQVKSWLTPNRDIPAALQYSNDTQRLAGTVTQFLVFLLGIGLILSWLRSRWLKRTQ
ncbi:MAG: hypothetical protein ACRD3N_10870 [Terracidiphilus sp.]